MTDDTTTLPADEAPASSFPLVRGRAQGYEPGAVDEFLQRARTSYERDDGEIGVEHVRAVTFPLRRGGYEVTAVDAALGRIEDALADRRRERTIARDGAKAWVERARAEAQVVLDRLSREPRRRFDRVGPFRHGYAVDEVDQAADRVVRFLAEGESLTAEQVRRTAFRMRRNGYREEQVDAVLAAVVDVILAVR